VTDKKPQTLLSRGNLSLVKYQITGRDKIDSGIMIKSLNKNIIAQLKKGLTNG
jgi:hypothetical protein